MAFEVHVYPSLKDIGLKHQFLFKVEMASWIGLLVCCRSLIFSDKLSGDCPSLDHTMISCLIVACI